MSIVSRPFIRGALIQGGFAAVLTMIGGSVAAQTVFSTEADGRSQRSFGDLIVDQELGTVPPMSVGNVGATDGASASTSAESSELGKNASTPENEAKTQLQQEMVVVDRRINKINDDLVEIKQSGAGMIKKRYVPAYSTKTEYYETNCHWKWGCSGTGSTTYYRQCVRTEYVLDGIVVAAKPTFTYSWITSRSGQIGGFYFNGNPYQWRWHETKGYQLWKKAGTYSNWSGSTVVEEDYVVPRSQWPGWDSMPTYPPVIGQKNGCYTR